MDNAPYMNAQGRGYMFNSYYMHFVFLYQHGLYLYDGRTTIVI